MDEEILRRLEAAQEIAGAFMARVDWDRVAAGRDLALTLAVFLRRRPWVLIAAGAALTALGAYALMKEAAAEREREERALLEAPATSNGHRHG